MATVTLPGSFMATIMHPTGNGYCRDRILRDSPSTQVWSEEDICLSRTLKRIKCSA